MRTKYSLKFYPNKYTEKKGLCKIYGRIRYKQKKSEFATHLSIRPSEWNEEFMQPVNNPYIKRELAKIENDIYETVMRLEYEDIHIDAKAIKDYYTGKEKIDIGIVEYMDRIIQLKEKTTTSSNHNKYVVLKRDVQSLIKQAYQSNDINLKKIDYKFITNFDSYLRSSVSRQFKQNLKPATIAKKHEYLRAVLRQALHEDLIRKTPYHTFKIAKPFSPPKSLSKNELIKIERLDLSGNIILDRVRDVFLFSVYTGFRFGDAMRLTMDNIIVAGQKYEAIYLNAQQKNTIPVHLPILPKANEIIRKYENSTERLVLNKLLPQFSNTHFNKKIKEVGRLCGIKINLHHHIARHTFATTILTENGVSIYEVQKWMGHSSISSTKIYSHVTPSRMKKTADRLSGVL